MICGDFVVCVIAEFAVLVQMNFQKCLLCIEGYLQTVTNSLVTLWQKYGYDQLLIFPNICYTFSSREPPTHTTLVKTQYVVRAIPCKEKTEIKHVDTTSENNSICG